MAYTTKTTFRDLITGEERPMVFRGEPLKPNERWLKNANYRKARKKAKKRCSTCSQHKYRHFADKCEKVGITPDTASNINPDYVCDLWTKPSRKGYK